MHVKVMNEGKKLNTQEKKGKYMGTEREKKIIKGIGYEENIKVEKRLKNEKLI